MTILTITAVVSVLVWAMYEYRLARDARVFDHLPLYLDIRDRDAERFEVELRAARDRADR
ncbi:MAG TPA: hypothetical protein VIQ30_13965 [Pseudonocardia sp.]|jgi:hypothetical protein